MIEIKNLTKKYGDIKAVDNISFNVKEGEVLGFLGPNGAGKSTTMNILTGAISASNGSVKVDGYDVLEEPEEAKKAIGYLPERPPLYEDMTVTEYLKFISDLKLVPKNEQIDELARIMASLKITDVRKRLIGNLSKGYRQRVGIAQAMVGNPKVLVLDEPTVGLDPKQILDIRKLIRDLGKKHTVILSSHILSEIQATCDRVVIISNGQLAYEGDIKNMGETVEGISRVEIIAKGTDDRAMKLLNTINGITKTKLTNRDDNYSIYEYDTAEGLDLREEVFSKFANNRIPLIGMRSLNPTLEDIFLSVTSGSNEYTKGRGANNV